MLGNISFSTHVVGSSITAEFFAPGYSTRRLTADIINNTADFGAVTLSALASLRISEVRLFLLPAQDPKHKQSAQAIDFFVSNETDSRKTVDTISIIASRRRLTNCGDVPGLHAYVFQVAGTLNASTSNERLALDITGVNGSDAAVAARGQMEYLPCKQARLRLDFLYPWDVEAGKRMRIRLVLPKVSAEPPGKGVVNLNLDLWEVAALHVMTSDGARSEASVPTSARR